MSYGNALIVLNYNDWESCINLVQMVAQYSNIDEIVIVDNKSSDDSFERLSKAFCSNTKVHIIESPKNGGYAYGNNYGCQYAIKELNAKYLTIANPDVSFSEDVMRGILDFIDCNSDLKVGTVSVKMDCHSSIDLPSAWKLPSFGDCILEHFMLIRRLVGNRTRYSDKYLTDKIFVAVDVIAGSFFCIKSDAFLSVGGFDDRTFLYYEENILSKKLIDRGYTNYLLCNYSYDHMHSVSIDSAYKNVKSRLKLAYDSRKIYVNNYLHCNSIQRAILRISFEIGVQTYYIAYTLRGLLKKVSK